MKLKDARGRLTRYGFACGYVEFDGPFRLSMEHGVYHVKGFDANGVRHWDTARTLTEARKLLRDIGNIYGRLPITRGIYAPKG